MHRVRAYIFDFCGFFSVAYITLNKLHTVFLYYSTFVVNSGSSLNFDTNSPLL